MGGTHSSLLTFLARCIWLWCKERDIWLSAFHIPGSENGTADFQSRNFNDNTEWTLNKRVFDSLCDHFGNFEVDLFASRLNNQISNYTSWRPDPEALGVDAFSLNWSIYFSYGFPPFCLLGRVMNKISSDECDGVFVVPIWPIQPWFPEMLRLLVSPPVVLPFSKDLLLLPSRSTIHPLYPKLRLMACHLSGKVSKTKEFQRSLVRQSLQHGDVPPNHSMRLLSRSGISFVLKGKSIPTVHLF